MDGVTRAAAWTCAGGAGLGGATCLVAPQPASMSAVTAIAELLAFTSVNYEASKLIGPTDLLHRVARKRDDVIGR